jgi:hypothetical protein
MSLEGKLSDFGVADIFQLIAQQRKTGVLEVRNGESTFEIHFVSGSVLRAWPAESRPDGALAAFLLRTGLLAESDLAEVWREQEETLEPFPSVLASQGLVSKEDLQKLQRLLSDETIFELFLWDQGSFEFHPQPVNEREGDQLIGAEMVLLDALRMRDEWGNISRGLPDPSAVLAPTADIEDFARRRPPLEESSGLAGEQLQRLYTLSDGRLTLRRIMDLSRLGTFTAGRGLFALLRGGILHVERSKVRREEIEAAGSRFDVAPIVLGVCAALACGLALLPRPTAEGWPIPSAVLAAARDQSAEQRLRAALEARRWTHGAYPLTLAELAGEVPGLLAHVSLDRYSYALSENGYTLVLADFEK